MRIQHNIMAMSAYRNYTNNVSAMKKNLEKLSSGYKINRAGDDAAGLAISEKMRAQITGLETAQKNAKDGISLVQTAEGALTEVHDMLNRMVELATQSANGTYDNTTDRAQMQKEVDQLLEEIDRIADSSNFNGINLLDGTLGLNTDAFQVVAGDAYQEAVAASAIVPTTSNYHGGSSVTGQSPSITIDLNDIEIKNTATATATVGFTIKAGGLTIDAKATGIAASATVAGAKIQAAVQAALDALASGTDGNGKATIKMGGLYMKYTVSSTAVKFEFDSVGGTKTQTWNDVVSGSAGKATAKAFNDAWVGVASVTVTAGSNAKLTGGKTEIHALTTVKNAVADEPAQRPGIDIDIADLVKNGYKLTIASGTGAGAAKTTYVFKTDKNSTVTAATGETLVDVSKIDAADQARHAAWIIAGGAANGADGKPNGNADGQAQTAAGIFKVGMKTGTTIHIDVAAAANASKADSEAKMKALITAEKPAQTQKAANTKLVISGPAKEGNVLTIGDDKITLNEGDDAAKVMAAIQGKGYTVTMADGTGDYAGKKVLTIDAKTAAASVNGPTILGKGLTLQIGDTSDDFNQLNVTVQDCHAASLGVGGLDISTEEAAQQAIAKIKSAVNFVSDVRGTLGATQNRLDHTINNLSVMTENIQDAESTIRDVDVAEEMMAYTKNNILIQSAQAMLAQANQVPQGVLQLLQ